jgi:type II secretory pathway predicted ATPase ExeA
MQGVQIMYLDFYDLYRAPFHITPDPDFFYSSPVHREALAAFIYGVEMRKGFISITGEVGTGKTTIIRAFLNSIDSQTIRPVFLFNTDLSFHELLRTTLREIGITPESDDVSQMLCQLQDALIRGYEDQQNFILIIDEAQNMSIETLKSLHMLSNIETVKEKLIQIVLIGQPELNIKLQRPELRQIKQRIAIRVTLQPLSRRESRDYIHHRLAMASNKHRKRFTSSAVRRIISQAKGRPRELNILCDNALIAGYGYQKATVTAKIANEVIADYEGKRSPIRGRLRLAATIGGLAGIAMFLGIYSSHSLPLISQYTGEMKPFNRQTALQKPYSPSKSAASTAPSGVSSGGLDAVVEKESILNASPEVVIDGIIESTIEPDDRHQPARDPEGREENSLLRASQTVIESEPSTGTSQAVIAEKRRFPVKKIVKSGDCFSKLCAEVYGSGMGNDKQLANWLKEHNPHIRNLNKLSIGQEIVFPELEKGMVQNDQNL